jgi:hypothetical protein
MGIPCKMVSTVVNMPRDCPATCNLCPPASPTNRGAAIPGTCAGFSNGIKDGFETDVDCGGDAAMLHNLTCSMGDACFFDGDCGTSYCEPSNLTCMPGNGCGACPQDNQISSNQTCVDGGGAACRCLGRLCDDFLPCQQGGDCQSGHCYNSICVSCSNGQKDGDESDVDCGGSSCTGCADNRTCALQSDCTSRHCTAGVCTSFSNNIRDGELSLF